MEITSLHQLWQLLIDGHKLGSKNWEDYEFVYLDKATGQLRNQSEYVDETILDESLNSLTIWGELSKPYFISKLGSTMIRCHGYRCILKRECLRFLSMGTDTSADYDYSSNLCANDSVIKMGE